MSKRQTGIFDGMRTVLLKIDQLDPFFTWGDNDYEDNYVKIPVKQRDNWRRVLKEFKQVQKEMKAAIDPSPGMLAKRKKRKHASA